MPKLIVTSDGSHSLHSEQYGVSYHSKFGAIQETEHVFVKAGLLFLAKQKSRLRVMDIGFGTGLNTLLSFLAANDQQLSIDYTAVEAYPVEMPLVRQLNYCRELKRPELQESFLRMHEMQWDTSFQEISPHFSFRKLRRTFQNIDLEEEVDVIYFDAFAPNAQPELWELSVLFNMYRALKPGGVLTTYCAKGVVKRNLKTLGFRVEALPGPPGKREMTRAHKPT